MDRAHLGYLFLALDGRIPRKAYWIGTLILVGVSAVLYFLLAEMIGLTLDDVARQDPRIKWMTLGVTVLLLYPGLAVMIKRLHDRNRTGWWAGLAYGLSILVDGLHLAGFAGTAESPSVPMEVLGWIVLIVGLWIFVETGFLKGTSGDNDYGPDPLGGAPDATFD